MLNPDICHGISMFCSLHKFPFGAAQRRLSPQGGGGRCQESNMEAEKLGHSHYVEQTNCPGGQHAGNVTKKVGMLEMCSPSDLGYNDPLTSGVRLVWFSHVFSSLTKSRFNHSRLPQPLPNCSMCICVCVCIHGCIIHW